MLFLRELAPAECSKKIISVIFLASFAAVLRGASLTPAGRTPFALVWRTSHDVWRSARVAFCRLVGRYAERENLFPAVSLSNCYINQTERAIPAAGLLSIGIISATARPARRAPPVILFHVAACDKCDTHNLYFSIFFTLIYRISFDQKSICSNDSRLAAGVRRVQQTITSDRGISHYLAGNGHTSPAQNIVTRDGGDNAVLALRQLSRVHDFDEDLQFLLAMKLLKSKKEKKILGSPYKQRRQDKGEFHRLVRELESDDEKFHQYFRMNQAQYEEIHSLIEGDIKKYIQKFREPIGFECDPDDDDDWIYVGD
ncbi:hypothetical protein EVAR_65101_1 [Eumeta japonica]|uniref:Uncharacterized protein n=1 Tax=Eumeta variegata TaxID=151549 RepID=A0A4C1ZX89_EUMVA|nr:hypothetical protein EVAR_65101_1 [Eumeta japonica]